MSVGVRVSLSLRLGLGRKLLRSGDGVVILVLVLVLVVIVVATIVAVEMRGGRGAPGGRITGMGQVLDRSERRRREGRLGLVFPAEEGHGDGRARVRGSRRRGIRGWGDEDERKARDLSPVRLNFVLSCSRVRDDNKSGLQVGQQPVIGREHEAVRIKGKTRGESPSSRRRHDDSNHPPAEEETRLNEEGKWRSGLWRTKDHPANNSVELHQSKNLD